jgi:hypothetical protein
MDALIQALNYSFDALRNPGALQATSLTLLGSTPATNVVVSDTYTDWLDYTPTLTASGGTLTSYDGAVGKYKQVGKTVTFYAGLHIILNGTGSGSLIVSLPVNPNNFFVFSGTGVDFGGAVVPLFWSSSTSEVYVKKFDGTYPGTDDMYFGVSGVYEAI